MGGPLEAVMRLDDLLCLSDLDWDEIGAGLGLFCVRAGGTMSGWDRTL